MIYPIITLTQIKSWMAITTSSNDTQLKLFQKVVTDIAENILGQNGVVRTIIEYLDGRGDQTILSKKYPIYSVSGLNDDPAYEWDSSTEISSVNYLVTNDKIGEIMLINNYSDFLKGKNSIKLTYRAGYSRFVVITGVNDTIDFNEGSDLVATVSAGTYDAEDLATAIASAMNTAGALTYTCTYSHAAQTFSIVGSSSLTYKWADGDNFATSIASLINVAETNVTNTTTTSGEVLGIPQDITNACQMIFLALWNMSKQGGGLQMIQSKQMAASASGTGNIDYYGDKLPTIAVEILKRKRRIAL